MQSSVTLPSSHANSFIFSIHLLKAEDQGERLGGSVDGPRGEAVDNSGRKAAGKMARQCRGLWTEATGPRVRYGGRTKGQEQDGGGGNEMKCRNGQEQAVTQEHRNKQ